MKLVEYRISVDPDNSKTAPGDGQIWLTDGVTTHAMTGPLYTHGHNLGWYPGGPDGSGVVFVPLEAHAALLANTSIVAGSVVHPLSDDDVNALVDKILAEEAKRLGVKA